jgi:integrase
VIVKPLPDELVEIIRGAEEVWSGPRDYLIPNRRTPRRDGARSALQQRRVRHHQAPRRAAGVDVHPHALRAAFAVRFDEQTSEVI